MKCCYQNSKENKLTKLKQFEISTLQSLTIHVSVLNVKIANF